MRNHLHVIITAKVKVIPDVNELEEWMKEVVRSVDMNIINGPHFCYSALPSNSGWTGIAVLDFSHIALHTWDDDQLIEFDLFSCKDFDVNDVIKQLDIFEPEEYNVKVLTRNKL